MKLKSVLLTGLSFVLVAAIAVGGTLAYLTSTDDDVNVMTLGNVKIEQHEYERVVDANGNYTTIDVNGNTSYELKDFSQGKPLLPATLVTNGPGWDYEPIYVRMAQVESHGGAQMFNTPNAVDKLVTVENTGKSDAYVRTIIAYEMGALTEDEFNNVIGMGTFKTEPNEVWPVTDIGVAEINGNKYFICEYIYNGAAHMGGVHDGVLPAGETSYPSLCQVYMHSSATNEDCEKVDGNKNGTYDILVVSQAVQTAGFADAETALNAGFGDITTTNHPWAGEGNAPVIPVTVATADELIEALENGEDVVLTDDVKIDPAAMSNAYGTTGINVKNGQTIDGNGNTLDIKGAGGTWDSGVCTSGGTIKNITVTGSFRGIFIKKDTNHNERVVLENVIIDGTTYTVSVDSGTGEGLTAINSTFNGWTSYAGTLGDTEFIDCSFGEGNGYAYCRPYAPTTFVGCEFEAGYTLDPRAAVTFENCTLDGVALTDANIADLVTDTAKVTVK